jgi:prepilin-type N-terminal cleavage/methylation domain-containing protein
MTNRAGWSVDGQAGGRARPSKPRRGFTLLEVLAACVLASLLTMLVSRLMRNALLETREAQRVASPLAGSWLLRHQLDEDILHARAFAIGPQAITLGGYLARHPMSGLPTQRMAVVTYRIVEVDGRGLLRREELLFLPDGERRMRAEVVWEGVRRMVAIPRAEMLSGEAFIYPELESLGLQPLIAGVTLQLYDQQDRLFLEVL